LSNEFGAIEGLLNNYLACLTPPSNISEAVIDHDYTVLALKRYNEGSKEFWSATIKWMKRVESTVIEPIKSFVNHELASLRSLRRSLEFSQRGFDAVVARYAAQNKTKEASSLREDAFQLFEARKLYLKSSMEFCVAAPQVKVSLDKLLVKIFSDRWREMTHSRDASSALFLKSTADIQRVRGWSREMENYERVFAQELQLARKQIEDVAEQHTKPSRDLDTYSSSTVPFIANSNGPLTPSKPTSEKQGWLFQKTLSGKPARTVWVRRWFYVKNGVFGWLAQSAKSSSVEESEKIGVLLCGVRPATQEERRFCFEVKTKDSTLILQSETQAELMEWIAAFEIVKRKALENPSQGLASMQGAPFAISPAVSPEFAAKVQEKDEDPERSGSLNVDSPAVRASMDVRRPAADDSTSRIMSKLSKSSTGQAASSSTSPSMGGIASLIAASHSVLPISPTPQPLTLNTDFKKIIASNIPMNTLAPSTLANPPIPTNMSKTAIIVGAEKGLSLSGTGDGGLPAALMANLWGSTSWGRINKLEIPENEHKTPSRVPSRVPSPAPPGESEPKPVHKRSVSAAAFDLGSIRSNASDDYPNCYPASLKMQDVQFKMLFPTDHHHDKLVMVFRATWNPSDQQEFPGRVYVTMDDIYFYSNHLGLVLITNVSLDSISEITAAPGKDCDFLFIHLKEGMLLDGATRITVKTFLENQKLLRQRLDYLVHNRQSSDSTSLEEVIKALLKLESQPDDSPIDSWDDMGAELLDSRIRHGQDLKTSLHIDGSLQSDPMKRTQKSVTKFRLPAHPVEFTPRGFKTPVLERQYEITPKSLFHVLAGDKSAVFQILYCQRGANSK
jgi:PH domain